MSSTDKVITQKDVKESFFNSLEEAKEELKSLKEKGVSTRYLKVNDKVYKMGLVKEIKINTEDFENSKKIIFYNSNSQFTKRLGQPKIIHLGERITWRYEWNDDTVDYIDTTNKQPDLVTHKVHTDYKYNIKYLDILKYEDTAIKEQFRDFFIKEFYDFLIKWSSLEKVMPTVGNEIEQLDNLRKETEELIEEHLLSVTIDGNTNVEEKGEDFLLYPIIPNETDDEDRP